MQNCKYNIITFFLLFCFPFESGIIGGGKERVNKKISDSCDSKVSKRLALFPFSWVSRNPILNFELYVSKIYEFRKFYSVSISVSFSNLRKTKICLRTQEFCSRVQLTTEKSVKHRVKPVWQLL